MTFFPRKGLLRRVDGGAFVASNAIVTGDVSLGEDVGVWFGCVVRGDDAALTVGRRTNVQDLTMIHADTGVPNVLGEEITIGHRCVLHGARIEDRCLIGMGAVLLGGSVIGKESLIAAGAVVKEGFVVPPRSLVAGVPGKILRSITDVEVEMIRRSAEGYVRKIRLYLDAGEPGGESLTSVDLYAERLEHLRENLAPLERVAVAFSGGVDSSVLLHVARSVLGEGAVGVIADSPSLPRRELELAKRTALAIGAPLVVIATDEMQDERYLKNAGDRCYFCKSALFRSMEPWARADDFRALAFGEIADDLLDVRPGARAAREFGVVAPLSAAGFTKEDVRRYAREAGLDVAEKPASACLSSRLPVGTVVTRERLARIERCEDALRDLGLRELRVRDHGPRARVEVGRRELAFARANAPAIGSLLAAEGFADVELDAYVPPADRVRGEGRS